MDNEVLEKSLRPDDPQNESIINAKNVVIMSDRGIPHPVEFLGENHMYGLHKDDEKGYKQKIHSEQGFLNLGSEIHSNVTKMMERNRGIHEFDSPELKNKHRELYLTRMIPKKDKGGVIIKHKEPLSDSYIRFLMSNALEKGQTGIGVNDKGHGKTFDRSIGDEASERRILQGHPRLDDSVFLTNQDDTGNANVRGKVLDESRKKQYILYDSDAKRHFSNHVFSVDQAVDFLHAPDHHDLSHIHLVPVDKMYRNTINDPDYQKTFRQGKELDLGRSDKVNPILNLEKIKDIRVITETERTDLKKKGFKSIGEHPRLLPYSNYLKRNSFFNNLSNEHIKDTNPVEEKMADNLDISSTVGDSSKLTDSNKKEILDNNKTIIKQDSNIVKVPTTPSEEVSPENQTKTPIKPQKQQIKTATK